MTAAGAVQSLEPGTPDYRRADDILLVTDANNPDNRDMYRRNRRFSLTVE